MPFEQAPTSNELPKAVFIFDRQGVPMQFGEHARMLITRPVFVSVQDNGAMGDGTTDDTASIQNTINDAEPGSTIYFPPGIYLISKTLQIKNSQCYLGGGYSYRGATIKQANNANLIALMAVTEYMTNSTFSSSPLRIANLYFEGNWANNPRPPSNGGHGIIFMSSDTIIEECWFHDIPQTAILFSDRNLAGTIMTNTSIENHILNCKVDTVGQYGIWVRDQANGRCTDGYIRDCVINNTANTAILVERSAGWFLSGNHVYACQQSGIVLGNAWATSVIGNEVDGYGYNLSNTAMYQVGLGVTCLGPRATIVEGNIISTPETNPHIIYQHLVINGGASTDARCIVTGNHILGGYVNTTSSSPITVPGPQTIQVAGVTNVDIGQMLSIDVGSANQENVTVTAYTQSLTAGGNTISANFARRHSGTYYITSGTPTSHSIGIVIQSMGTQKLAGQPFYVQLALNRVEGVGREYTYDAAPTTIISQSRMLGDIQADGSIQAARHIIGNGPVARISSGESNGQGAPVPNINGNDVRGTVNFGCGSNATSGVQVNIQYASPYAYVPVVVISSANAATAHVGHIWYTTNSTTNGFSIASTTAPARTEQAATTFSFNYQVVG